MNMQDNDTQDDDQGFDEAVSAPMVRFDIRHLSVVNGTRAFAIHGADGTPMAVAGAEDLAFAAIRQHEMVPALVH
jgi:hypothetical protein